MICIHLQYNIFQKRVARVATFFLFSFFQIADSIALLSFRVFISTASLLPACSMCCGNTAQWYGHSMLSATDACERWRNAADVSDRGSEAAAEERDSKGQSGVSSLLFRTTVFFCADKKPAHFPYLFSLKLKEEVLFCFFCWWQSWAEIWRIGAPRSGDGHLPGGVGLPAVTPCRRWDKPASDIHKEYFIHIHCHILKQMKVFYNLNRI